MGQKCRNQLLTIYVGIFSKLVFGESLEIKFDNLLSTPRI